MLPLVTTAVGVGDGLPRSLSL